MPTDASHGEWRDQAALYVLGALSRQERAVFEGHLAACAECAADVRRLTPLTGALAQAVPQLAPPPELRNRVLAAVSSGLEPSRAVNIHPHATEQSIGAWLAAAAAIALAVALAAYGLELRSRIAALEGQLAAAEARAAESGRSMVELRRTALESQSAMSVLTAPDLARVDLAGQRVAPTASARAFWSRSRGLVFTASNLPALPPGRTYQLWVVAASMPISAGLVKPGSDGAISAFFHTPVDLPTPVAMAVTIEPDGGLPAPTGDKYLIGLVTASVRSVS